MTFLDKIYELCPNYFQCSKIDEALKKGDKDKIKEAIKKACAECGYKTTIRIKAKEK